jgi:hypothetical protein
MWTTSKPLNAKICPRPARIAYLVPEDPSEVLLDTLFAESLSRWGGRRTPLIPTNGKSIAAAYLALLNLWDADIIYSYVGLSEEIEKRLFCIFAPSEIRFHDGLTDRKDAHGLRPDYTGNFTFLSSLSLLPFFARRSQMTGVELPEIVDKEPWVRTDRDLEDSFGFVSSSCNDLSLLPYARRLSLRPKRDAQIAQRFREPNEISYVEDIESLVEKITKRPDLLTLIRLSDMLCPHLRFLARGRAEWDDHLTIVIGDQTADRLLFWNAQHRYPSLDGLDDIPVLRLSPKRFKDGSPEWLKHWIAIRNRRHIDGNAAPRTVLRSCSLSKEQLDLIAVTLGDKHKVMISCEHHAEPNLFDDSMSHTAEHRKNLMAQSSSAWTHPAENRHSGTRFQNNHFELPLTPPWHVKDVSPSGLTRGVWAVDLSLERAEDHSTFTNERHIWKWPRRLRLEQAIGFENYIGPHSLILPPPVRPTEYGDLTIWDCASWTRPTFNLPSDYQAFVSALVRFVSGSIEERKALESNLPTWRFDRVTISDKGRDLLGVFQFFRSLPEALAFLTDEFWRDAIRRLSPEEPANNNKNIRDLTRKLQEIVQQSTPETRDFESLAKRALSLAARSFASQGEQSKWAKFEKLSAWAAKATGQNQSKIENRLTESVTYLRDQDFLRQGFGWRCTFCQHHNWIALERLTPISKCEICRKPQSSPVSGSLHFRLNPFVQHAFASTSGQEPVIWCLDQLARRARSSFAFAPTLNVYRPGKSNPETDLDLVVAVDGEVYVVEVKSSFAGVEAEVLEQLQGLADELRPDVVMLAVKANWSDDAESANMIKTFERNFPTNDVRFELLTLERADQSVFHDKIALQGSNQMNWSAW